MHSITAIVPTYNRAAFLKEALHSLAAQTRPVDEIIVWDDGSTDGTETAVRETGLDLRYFRSTNGGKSRALNAALREARGDYIWVCDDDDLALPHAAATLAGMLDRDPRLGVAGGGYRRFSIDKATGTAIEQDPGYWPDLSQGAPVRHLLEDIFLFQNATLVRRELYETVGPFREDLARSIDYDMIVRLGLAAPIQITDDALFLQRKHDGDRGPAAARHAAARSDAVWKTTDRAIFEEFRNIIPLDFYCAMFETPDPQLARRAALLQRACVYARRTDWPNALTDFQDAAHALPDSALTDLERQICRRALAGKHGIEEAMGPDVRRALGCLAMSSTAGADIARALARGLVWRLRQASGLREAGKLVALGASLIKGGKTSGGKKPTAEITERNALPLDTYGA